MDGVINIYKEKGYTSHDAVAVVRRALKIKAGHTGTLDPMAEGVLPVCVGKATRLADYIMGGVKEYRAGLVLGAVTDTEDSHGLMLEQKDVSVTREQLEACVDSFIGAYEQMPPMYSAVKINGQRLYKLARAGVTVERASRTVEIHSIRVTEFFGNEAVIEVVCGKGTYIRTLCADIGQKLGCGAHMGELLRLRSGDFTADKAFRLSEVERLAAEGRAEECCCPVTQVLAEYKYISVKKAAEKYLRNGNKLRRDQLLECALAEDELVLLHSAEGAMGLYRHTEGILKCEIML